jgi:hypothetical protein
MKAKENTADMESKTDIGVVRKEICSLIQQHHLAFYGPYHMQIPMVRSIHCHREAIKALKKWYIFIYIPALKYTNFLK